MVRRLCCWSFGTVTIAKECPALCNRSSYTSKQIYLKDRVLIQKGVWTVVSKSMVCQTAHPDDRKCRYRWYVKFPLSANPSNQVPSDVETKHLLWINYSNMFHILQPTVRPARCTFHKKVSAALSLWEYSCRSPAALLYSTGWRVIYRRVWRRTRLVCGWKQKRYLQMHRIGNISVRTTPGTGVWNAVSNVCARIVISLNVDTGTSYKSNRAKYTELPSNHECVKRV